MNPFPSVGGGGGVVVSAAVILGSTPPPPVHGILDGAGSESRQIGGLWWLLFGLAAAVYGVVAGLVLVGVARHRGGHRSDPDDPPPLTDDDARGDDRIVWIAGLLIPLLILAVLGVVTVTTTNGLRRVSANAMQIEVVGHRWWWEVRYPASGDVRTANEIHVPVGQPIDLLLQSDNVVHSFWVPSLAGKVDMIPGQINHLRFTAEQAGVYDGQCAEFCGLAHAQMRFVVVAQPPAEFERFLARRTSGQGAMPEDELAARGEVVFHRATCSGCHTIAGTDARGTRGPDLTDFGHRASIGANIIPNTPEDLRRWLRDPGAVKPGALMPPSGLSDDDLRAVVAYLEGLG